MTFNHITPAILPKSYDDLVRHLDRVSGIVKTVQVDVVDGVLAPNKTWPFVQDTDGQFLKILRQEEGLPYWDSIDYEIDLMVSDPVFVSDQWIAAGANRIVIHVKSLQKKHCLNWLRIHMIKVSVCHLQLSNLLWNSLKSICNILHLR